MSKKTTGIVSVHCKGVEMGQPLLYNAITGGKVNMHFKHRLSDWLILKFLDAEEKGYALPIFCKKVSEGKFTFIGMNDRITKATIGKRKKTEKRIAYDNLISEVNKDYNPVHTGSVKQKMTNGRKGLTTNQRLSGKIGFALQKNINLDSPERQEYQRLAAAKRERRAELLRIRQKKERLDKAYYDWIDAGSLPDNDASWLKFLDHYEARGESQKRVAISLPNELEKLRALESEEETFSEFSKMFKT